MSLLWHLVVKGNCECYFRIGWYDNEFLQLVATPQEIKAQETVHATLLTP